MEKAEIPVRMRLGKIPSYVLLALAIFIFQSYQIEREVQAAGTAFPERNIFPKLLADPEEINTVALLGRQDGNSRIDFSIGHYFGMHRWQFEKEEKWTIQWGFSFIVFGRILDFDEMKANDFMLNIPVEIRKGIFSGRLTLGHESAHLGDELIARTMRQDIEFSREFIKGIISVQLTEHVRIYGGGTYILSASDRLGRTQLQAGFELRSSEFRIVGEHNCRFYLAHDIQAKEEIKWKRNHNTQVGIGIQLGESHRRVRLFGNYFDGRSTFGQFFQDKESLFSFGIGFDL